MRSLGSAKLVKRRGAPKDSKIEQCAMAFGPLGVGFRVSTVCDCLFTVTACAVTVLSFSLVCGTDSQAPFAVGRITLSFWVGLCDPLRMKNIINFPEQSASKSRPGNKYSRKQKTGLRKAAMNQFKRMCSIGKYNIANTVESALDELLNEGAEQA